MVLRHRESPDEANRGKSEENDDGAKTKGKQGVAEMRDSVVNCIVASREISFWLHSWLQF
ncbi:MAG: hypothetical protein A2156_14650 [Deltaproteobacteria bacterium RBG_16_48_10]|nr:MAG: hypothetical protein A2156_14650 [Deltaproteobacteria bacterium RBG_16_48_10]